MANVHRLLGFDRDPGGDRRRAAASPARRRRRPERSRAARRDRWPCRSDALRRSHAATRDRRTQHHSDVLRAGGELLKAPERPPGWTAQDPTVLQAQGRASARVAHLIEALATTRPALRTRSKHPAHSSTSGPAAGGSQLRRYASGRRSALSGSTRGRRRSASRIRTSRKTTSRTASSSGFMAARRLRTRTPTTLIWFPSPFIPPHVAGEALSRAVRALRPGGWMIFGLPAAPPDRLSLSLQALRLTRSGGHRVERGRGRGAARRARSRHDRDLRGQRACYTGDRSQAAASAEAAAGSVARDSPSVGHLL